MNLVPIGVAGELCVAGVCVGGGYLNLDELTNERFVKCPFRDEIMYHTGDIVRWKENGEIEYIGRNDFQVKIRGLRIELGEIENAISLVDGINQAIAVVRKDSNERQLICAFYTGKEMEAGEIREKVGDRLPKYMIPHVFRHMDMLPLTSSGKINRKALPDINFDNIATIEEYVAPDCEIENALCKIVGMVLGIKKVGINDDFFNLGGDSLKAIQYVSKAHSEGVYFTLQNVFDYPTVSKLYKYLLDGDNKNIIYKESDFYWVKELFKQKVGDKLPKKQSMGDVLLTGATGFLGIHILAEFIKVEKGIIYCLIRGNKEDALERFRKLLQYYFDDTYLGEIGKRIRLLEGDLTEDMCGLGEVPKISMLINAAASVKHYGSYKYFYETNVVGTKHALQVAQKVNAQFVHISTLSISGNSMVDVLSASRSESEKIFTETDFYIGQELNNVYIRSKFEAELEIFKAIKSGFNANIIRVGNLTNRYNDLKFQTNYESNAFLKRVKAILEMGVLPDYLMKLYCEFSPVDDTSKAVIKIAENFNMEHFVFHVNSDKVIYFKDLVYYIKKTGVSMRIVNAETFAKVLADTENNVDTRYIYEAVVNDMDEKGNLIYDSNIRILNDCTREYLHLIGFEWNDINERYIKEYIEYFRKLGYLEV